MALTGYNSQVVGSHATLATLSSATVIATPEGGDAVQFQPATQSIRYTTDGTTPTSTVGFLVTAGTMVLLDMGSSQTLKVIETTASASLQYQWFRTIRDTNT